MALRRWVLSKIVQRRPLSWHWREIGNVGAGGRAAGGPGQELGTSTTVGSLVIGAESGVVQGSLGRGSDRSLRMLWPWNI